MIEISLIDLFVPQYVSIGSIKAEYVLSLFCFVRRRQKDTVANNGRR